MTASSKMVLHSQLYGCAKICGNAIGDAVLSSKNSVEAIVGAVYMVDPFSAGNAAQSDYVMLFTTRRSSAKTYVCYEDKYSTVLTE